MHINVLKLYKNHFNGYSLKTTPPSTTKKTTTILRIQKGSFYNTKVVMTQAE